MKHNPEYTMTIPFEVLFTLEDWSVVKFPGYEINEIWMGHCCDIKTLKKPVAFPNYPWVHTMGYESVECYRCFKQVPDTIKTIYILLQASNDH